MFEKKTFEVGFVDQWVPFCMFSEKESKKIQGNKYFLQTWYATVILSFRSQSGKHYLSEKHFWCWLNKANDYALDVNLQITDQKNVFYVSNLSA